MTRAAGAAGGIKALEKVYDRVRLSKAWDHLRAPGIRLVPGFGSSEPKVLVVGGAPGAMDNNHERPFAGATGSVLGDLMGTAGLFAEDQEYIRANAFLTNVIKYRLPGRRPSAEEIAEGQEVLRQEWAILGGPRVIVAMGASAWAAIYTGPHMFVGRPSKPLPDRTTEDGVALWRMLHPADALANPLLRESVEERWEALGVWLRAEGLVAPI